MFSNNILHFKANREKNLRIYCLDSRIRDQGWEIAVKKGKKRKKKTEENSRHEKIFKKSIRGGKLYSLFKKKEKKI